jgi:hypothetical protein
MCLSCDVVCFWRWLIAGGLHHRDEAAACDRNSSAREYGRAGSSRGGLHQTPRPALLVQPPQDAPLRHPLDPLRHRIRVRRFPLACGTPSHHQHLLMSHNYILWIARFTPWVEFALIFFSYLVPVAIRVPYLSLGVEQELPLGPSHDRVCMCTSWSEAFCMKFLEEEICWFCRVMLGGDMMAMGLVQVGYAFVLELQHAAAVRAGDADGQQLQESRAVEERGAGVAAMAQGREAEVESQRERHRRERSGHPE